MTFKNVSANGPKRTFVVDLVNGSERTIGKYENTSSVKISKTVDISEPQVQEPLASLEVADIKGIDLALTKLNNFLSRFGRKFQVTFPRRSCAVLLSGGHGTGKTFIMDKIAGTGWAKNVIRIQRDAKTTTVRTVFKNAKLDQPSIILIDELEGLVSREDDISHSIATALGEELDLLSQNSTTGSLPRVLVVAATLDPSVIPLSLKKRGRFKTEIPLPIPDASARKAILKSLAPPVHPDSRDQVLDRLGDRTHAYTPEDLASLLDAAGEILEERLSGVEESSDSVYLSQEDIEQALLLVRPTAMHDITLQPPTVRWHDIGGQENVKKTLRFAIETPLLVIFTHILFSPPH
jgi:AAA family ATPase